MGKVKDIVKLAMQVNYLHENMDCSEVADLYKSLEPNGCIITFKPVHTKQLVIPTQNKDLKFEYHTVYMYCNHILDPYLINHNLPLKDYIFLLTQLNNGNVISDNKHAQRYIVKIKALLEREKQQSQILKSNVKWN